MKFWVDAQLPPMLAQWLTKEYGVEGVSLRDLAMRDATDIEIFQAAHRAQVVVISKDSDFVELVSRHGSPPQLLWVTCGNVTNDCRWCSARHSPKPWHYWHPDRQSSRWDDGLSGNMMQ